MHAPYSQDFGEVGQENFGKFRFQFAKTLLPIVSGACPLKLLEVGCGFGEFARILDNLNLNFSVFLADVDFKKVRYVRQLGFSACNLNLNGVLPFKDASFEGVIMLEVIEHIPNAEGVITEVSRILRKGGFLLLSVPNTGHYAHRIKYLLYGSVFQDSDHYRFFNKRQLEKLLTDNNFAVENFIASGYIPLLNRLRSYRGRTPEYFTVPRVFQSILGNNFFVLARNRSATRASQS